LAFEIGFHRDVEFEVPFQELVGLLKADSPCLALYGVLIDDIRAWLPFFQNV
jgi:hypothetical protein